jgi:dihydrodipicolinate synthase/N-acetylneuraminate lyase
LLGLAGGSVRAPLRELTSEQAAALRADLAATGLLESAPALEPAQASR